MPDTIQHGIEPELYPLTTVVNLLVFVVLFAIYLLIRQGMLRLTLPEE